MARIAGTPVSISGPMASGPGSRPETTAPEVSPPATTMRAKPAPTASVAVRVRIASKYPAVASTPCSAWLRASSSGSAEA